MPSCGGDWWQLAAWRAFLDHASLLGALIIQSVNSVILLSGMPPEFNLVIKALIIIAILVIQSPTVKHALYILRASAEPQPSDPIKESERKPAMIRSTHLPLLITIATFVLAYTLCASQYPAMLSTRVVANLLTDNAFLGIAAVGMTFVILSGASIFRSAR